MYLQNLDEGINAIIKGALVLMVAIVALAFFAGREFAGNGKPEQRLELTAPACSNAHCSCKAEPKPTGKLGALK